ncbi:hypothetical protein DF3PB_220036 [uncultured Defluviicoccus sp.]|uniref:RiboL-PSP-HEPN domain-containing protein n=1 Tax=metagenome TaxID=256318 RepID=A0A380TBV0_9ZZZZ|nr:hypothetical protein DF3PB_220036 [uncultured Defluviicoccus sp.]
MTVLYKSYSYAYLLMAVHRSKNDLKQAKLLPFVECLNIILYSALAFEAFMNHVGAKVFPHWAPLKRKLSPLEKLEVVAAARGLEVDWGSRPYQSLAVAIAFRNDVAHAESTEIDIPLVSGEVKNKKGHWQSFCNRETALRISEDVESLIASLPNDLSVSMPKLSTLAEPIERDTST